MKGRDADSDGGMGSAQRHQHHLRGLFDHSAALPRPQPAVPEDLTVADLPNLPPTLDLMTAARALGIGRTKAYELARRGEFPCRIIRIGDLYRIATADLIRLVSSTDDDHEMRPPRS